METILIRELNTVLGLFPDFWDGDKLHRSRVIDAINQKEPTLIKALINNDKIKENYSSEIDGVLLFDFEKLISLLKYKEFWYDSFTKYRNTIGLTSEGKYLNYNSDVVLDFPFKDCVLEGGMTKEDQGKDEIYYNEVIARDEIDRLFAPKVLTKAKRYTKDGIEENITDFSVVDNLIIKGNNLIALHSLKERYVGKIKLIYIDPPYNTGNDSFKYNDRFNHSTWLTFIKNRLEIARDFLSDDGVIFVQCDDNEQAYLKVLMDEIFGRENFVSNVVWKGRGGRQDTKFIAQVHETIIVYAKAYTELKLSKVTIEDSSNYPYSDEKGKYKTQLVRKWGSNSRRIDRPNLYYEVDFNGEKIYPILPDGSDGCWRWSKNKLTKAIEDNQIVLLEKNNKKELYEKIYERDGTKEVVFNSWIEESFSGEGAKTLQNIFNKKVFDYPKPESLIKLFLDIATNENDIVLDFFLGSGTTAAVAHKMNRRYIGIEQMDYIEDVTVERLKKVISGEQGGISKDVEWQGGGSFVYVELMELNYRFIHEIEKAQDYEALTSILEEMKVNAHLNYHADLNKVLKTAYEMDGMSRKVSFDELELHEQKKLLIELLDKNQLYVNLSEINDKTLHVSDEDKAFNRSFYKKD